MSSLVYLVDDEAAIRDALTWLFRSRGIELKTFAAAEDFLSALDSGAIPLDQPAMLLLDVRMPDMTGVELFEILLQRNLTVPMPVIFLTGHGDVPMAVSMLKRGAFDFVEKPFNDNALVDRVQEALAQAVQRMQQSAGVHAVQTRLASLSPRELEVMDRILEGKYNKIIADTLNISMRTVEVHRARIFAKMGVKSAVELAQLLNKKLPDAAQS